MLQGAVFRQADAVTVVQCERQFAFHVRVQSEDTIPRGLVGRVRGREV